MSNFFPDQEFTLTEDHVKLVRQMLVNWQDCEYGAPEIDPKRPYGNSNVAYDIHEILTGKEWDYGDEDTNEMSGDMADKYYAIHRETDKALQIILASGSFRPGVYSAPAYTARWSRKNG